VSVTNFPKEGDDKAVSLRNSNYARFDLAYALKLKESYPDIWDKGGNIKGNAQFKLLSRIQKQGGAPSTRAEEKAIRLREAWAARHYGDHLLPGVVAQIKWLVVGELGEAGMKKRIEEAKRKADEDRARASGGASGTGEAGDHGQPAGRAGSDETPLYVQHALVRAVRREDRPTAKQGESRSVLVVDFVASTEVKDSHESIVKSNWRLGRFQKNPVLLWMHGRWNDLPTVGRVENLRKVGTSHEGQAVFAEISAFDQEVAKKYEEKFLQAFSIGFYPHTVRFEMHDDEEILVLDDIEILEISCVNVPSNPEALAKEARAYEMLLERARAARDPQTRDATPSNNPQPPALPPVVRAPVIDTQKQGEPTVKNILIRETDTKVGKDSVSFEMTDPNTNERVAVEVRLAPVPPLDVTKTPEFVELDTKHRSAESRATELTSKLGAAEARATELQGERDALKTQIINARVAAAEKALTERSGKKITPAEVPFELELARMYLVDLSPSEKDPKIAKGEEKWNARLAMIDGRPDLGLIGPPITEGDRSVKPAGQDPVVSAATDAAQANRHSHGGMGLANLIDQAPVS
jgi:hypothetical protein